MVVAMTEPWMLYSQGVVILCETAHAQIFPPSSPGVATGISNVKKSNQKNNKYVLLKPCLCVCVFVCVLFEI